MVTLPWLKVGVCWSGWCWDTSHPRQDDRWSDSRVWKVKKGFECERFGRFRLKNNQDINETTAQASTFSKAGSKCGLMQINDASELQQQGQDTVVVTWQGYLAGRPVFPWCRWRPRRSWSPVGGFNCSLQREQPSAHLSQPADKGASECSRCFN